MTTATVNLKLLPDLEQTVLREAARAQVSKSEWVRRAIAFYAEHARGSQPKGFVSALELAGDLVGSCKAAPTDLASNPKYMEGYGEGSAPTALRASIDVPPGRVGSRSRGTRARVGTRASSLRANSPT
jgi:hypothetical protein